MTHFDRKSYITRLNHVGGHRRTPLGDFAYQLIGELTGAHEDLAEMFTAVDDRDREIRLLRRSLRPSLWRRIYGWFHKPARAGITDLTEVDVEDMFGAIVTEYHRLEGTDEQPLTERELEFKTIADLVIDDNDELRALLALAVDHVESNHNRDACPPDCGTCRLQDRLAKRVANTTSTETGAQQS